MSTIFKLYFITVKEFLPKCQLGEVKGQIISKGLLGVLEFSQKPNERIRSSSKNEFVRSFFGRIRGNQKSFRNYLTFSLISEKNSLWLKPQNKKVSNRNPEHLL